MRIRFLIIGVVALILLGVGFSFAYYFVTQPKQDAAMPEPVTFPISSGGTSGGAATSSRATITVGTIAGQSLEVRDFIHDPRTVADVVNPGSYLLAGELGYCLGDGSCPVASDITDFSVMYSETTQAFTIVLLREPIGETRRRAEAFMLERLGITETEACALRYHLGVPTSVNETFAGRNLGFSFCSGAAKLP